MSMNVGMAGRMWTEADRTTYRREGAASPSNLTDAEWARPAPLAPRCQARRTAAQKTEMRAAMDAILYLLRTGCPWRYLPRDGFPPRSTVYNIFRKFQREGVSEAIWAELHASLRERLGREASPKRWRRARQPDLEVGGKGGGQDHQVGYDAGKKLKGRKLHALVDTEGPPMRVVVHSAAVQDRDGAALVLDHNRGPLPLAGTDLGRWRLPCPAGRCRGRQGA